MKALVIFASKSDEQAYARIASELKSIGIEFELRLASAHKTPELVEKIISKDYSLIISGAGLAAALPGVIAARKLVPVLGVPCEGAYEGLDAFLSIAQMPPGIPVLEVSAESAADEARKILSGKREVVISGEGKAAEKAAETLKELGIEFEKSSISNDAVNIQVIELGKKAEERKELIIYCPVSSGETKADDAVKAMKAARYGLWVGVNRGENAAVAAAEILGKRKEVAAYRKKLAMQVMQTDKEQRR